MNADEILEKVWEIVDQNSAELSQVNYLNLLNEITDEATMRAEAVEEEMNADDQ